MIRVLKLHPPYFISEEMVQARKNGLRQIENDLRRLLLFQALELPYRHVLVGKKQATGGWRHVPFVFCQKPKVMAELGSRTLFEKRLATTLDKHTTLPWDIAVHIAKFVERG